MNILFNMSESCKEPGFHDSQGSICDFTLGIKMKFTATDLILDAKMNISFLENLI